ncbi:MAG TPA: HPF/RaiA family ribosome-associated protein [Candidatus Dormibacteraeota bacterium]|nr:HPF/RaiA family ribosome-associated protein [Candidatus Dormibacteraeota bacterium]
MTFVARHPVPAELRRYAEEKLQRLERHGSVLEAALTVDLEQRRVPPATAELIVHLRHVRLTSHVEGTTLREVVDRVTDRGDRQVLRRKERVKEHKGRVGANGVDPTESAGPR